MDISAISTQLATIVGQNTVSSITTRISGLRSRKDSEATISEMQEIINSLLAEKQELIGIASAYKDELVSQQLAPGDIKYITDKVLPLIKSVAGQSNANPSAAATIESIESILSTEMFNVLQLLGFNFKRAVGEPLTDLANQAIASMTPPPAEDKAEIQALSIRRDNVLAEVAKDPDAYRRLRRLYGHED